MKLISYEHTQQTRYGVLQGTTVVDMRDCMDAAPATINEFAGLAGTNPALLAQVAARAASAASAKGTPLDRVRLLPCVPRPSKILCLGVNYHDHAAEGGNKVADYPTIFFRGPSSLQAHEGVIPMPAISDKLDYEAELALVIGKTARNICEELALDHVFAYACFNDATFRDYQRKTTQWTVGKNFDATGGFGPWLVTADEIPDPTKLTLVTRLNGQEVQRAGTDLMIFPIPELIAYISTFTELAPGEIGRAHV